MRLSLEKSAGPDKLEHNRIDAMRAEERLIDLVPTEGVEPTRPLRDNGF